MCIILAVSTLNKKLPLRVDTIMKSATNPMPHLAGYVEPLLVTHLQCAKNAMIIGKQATKMIIEICPF
jgi:hypothetical protein